MVIVHCRLHNACMRRIDILYDKLVLLHEDVFADPEVYSCLIEFLLLRHPEPQLCHIFLPCSKGCGCFLIAYEKPEEINLYILVDYFRFKLNTEFCYALPDYRLCDCSVIGIWGRGILLLNPEVDLLVRLCLKLKDSF